jgi:hypothetical protein
MCSDPHWWVYVYTWQTLIAGLFALVAAAATVWVTIIAANRQVAAAKDQTKAAEHETAVIRDIEDRRLASEAFAFHSMLEAAMGRVIEDAQAAKAMRWHGTTGPELLEAYEARRRIKRTGFVELRSGLLRFGGELTTLFLGLDGEIENFAAQVYTQLSGPSEVTYGKTDGLADALARIEQQATELRSKAEIGMKRYRDRLAKERK